jgi:predicted DsbA family dithiol-disulfide isomerase
MLEIEIFSDAICPWCFIGKRRLDAALRQAENSDVMDPEVRLRWRPYLLYPNLPVEGVDRGELLRRRYGPRGDKGRVPGTILAEAEAEGIALRYDLIQRTPNTRAAHRLVEWVFQHRSWQEQHALIENLFQAYFCQGLDVGDSAVLKDIATPLDLNQEAQEAVFNGQGEGGVSLDAEIDKQLQRAIDLGVSGVPGYVMGGGYLLPGAQSRETMQAIIQRAKIKFATK